MLSMVGLRCSSDETKRGVKLQYELATRVLVDPRPSLVGYYERNKSG